MDNSKFLNDRKLPHSSMYLQWNENLILVFGLDMLVDLNSGKGS